MRPLTVRDIYTLGDLDAANKNLTEVGHRGGWAKPMDCGGWNGSHHSATLAKLARRGFANRKGYRPGIRHVWSYKINFAGRAVLIRTRMTDSASIGQPMRKVENSTQERRTARTQIEEQQEGSG